MISYTPEELAASDKIAATSRATVIVSRPKSPAIAPAKIPKAVDFSTFTTAQLWVHANGITGKNDAETSVLRRAFYVAHIAPRQGR